MLQLKAIEVSLANVMSFERDVITSCKWRTEEPKVASVSSIKREAGRGNELTGKPKVRTTNVKSFKGDAGHSETLRVGNLRV